MTITFSSGRSFPTVGCILNDYDTTFDVFLIRVGMFTAEQPVMRDHSQFKWLEREYTALLYIDTLISLTT